jgi:Ni/Fe-hydrogenase subunit HybB-like protein
MAAGVHLQGDFWAKAARLLDFLKAELKPKGSLRTPFNIITGLVMLVGGVILVARFVFGLGAVTNLSQDYPWGLWIGFDVIAGVAFAGGAYVVCFLVYILGQQKYHAIVRITVLNGFLAYVFYAGSLLLDLGRPWNVVNPIIGNSFGVSSVLFLVAWHFLLYMLAAFLEFSPAVAEWLGLRRARRVLKAATLGAVIFGITLSMLHQSGLGALYLMAGPKIHPLWYSEFIPLLFLVSSIFAGLSMVIFEGTISHRVFHSQLEPGSKRGHERILVGLARICAGTLLVYLFMVLLTFVHGRRWHYLLDPMGAWWLVEVVGFVAVPLFLFVKGAQERRQGVIKVAAVMALFGILLNRLNISIIAFKWYAADRYVPHWMEIAVTAAIISAEIWVFRWVVNRMPVLRRPPRWARVDDGHEPASRAAHDTETA